MLSILKLSGPVKRPRVGEGILTVREVFHRRAGVACLMPIDKQTGCHPTFVTKSSGPVVFGKPIAALIWAKLDPALRISTGCTRLNMRFGRG